MEIKSLIIFLNVLTIYHIRLMIVPFHCECIVLRTLNAFIIIHFLLASINNNHQMEPLCSRSYVSFKFSISLSLFSICLETFRSFYSKSI